MHMTVEDQASGERTVICAHRGVAVGRVLEWTPSTLEHAVRLAQAMGLEELEIEGDASHPDPRPYGFGANYRVYAVRKLHGTQSTPRSLSDMPLSAPPVRTVSGRD